MLESSRSYLIKLDRILVAMSKSISSRKLLEIGFDIAKANSSEITAFTVKDERRDLTWSDKVAIVTDAYREGKQRGIRVVPKVRTASSIRECILDEINSHSYDLVMVASEKKYPVSAHVFGGIGDYILRNSRIPVIIVDMGAGTYPYRSILFPASETVATRASAYFAIQLMKATGSKLVIADLRGYDQNPVHRFSSIFENEGTIRQKLGGNIEIVPGGNAAAIGSEVTSISGSAQADVLVLGVRPDRRKNVRINSTIRAIIKESGQDVILVKK